jgi:hypothetical protein
MVIARWRRTEAGISRPLSGIKPSANVSRGRLSGRVLGLVLAAVHEKGLWIVA